ncbi:hypothetical protein TNCV_2834581 [Trichonephila clavipes]|nr:hypothetical protein TNCV_2834581 [Trichonephila clavipes]
MSAQNLEVVGRLVIPSFISVVVANLRGLKNSDKIHEVVDSQKVEHKETSVDVFAFEILQSIMCSREAW